MDEPKYWLSALRRGNATYAFFWSDDAAAPFHEVAVSVLNVGLVVVDFKFAHFDECRAEQDAADAAAF